jgi:hypothetical protein
MPKTLWARESGAARSAEAAATGQVGHGAPRTDVSTDYTGRESIMVSAATSTVRRRVGVTSGWHGKARHGRSSSCAPREQDQAWRRSRRRCFWLGGMLDRAGVRASSGRSTTRARSLAERVTAWRRMQADGCTYPKSPDASQPRCAVLRRYISRRCPWCARRFKAALACASLSFERGHWSRAAENSSRSCIAGSLPSIFKYNPDALLPPPILQSPPGPGVSPSARPSFSSSITARPAMAY